MKTRVKLAAAFLTVGVGLLVTALLVNETWALWLGISGLVVVVLSSDHLLRAWKAHRFNKRNRK